MKLNSKIYVAGHRGLVGSALVRRLQDKGYDNLVQLREGIACSYQDMLAKI
jgi:nucleoside-diphosphate-sugar epimerase